MVVNRWLRGGTSGCHAGGREFHAGWMYKRSSELGVDGKIDARKQRGRNRSVPRDFRAEPESLKGLSNRLISSIAVIAAEPAGQAACRRG